MAFPSEYYLYAGLILILAYFIRGITGFGSGLVAVPLLALFYPLTIVVPVVLLLDFSASLVMGGRDLKRIEWQEIRLLIPISFLGILIGSNLLMNLPRQPTLLILAFFIFIFAIRSLLNIQGHRHISRYWAIPAGLTGGTIGALFGTGGPPFVIYLNHRIEDKTKLRATFSALFFIDGLIRIITFFILGLFISKIILWGLVAGLPIMLGALYLGAKIHTGLSQTRLVQIIGLLLLGSSLSLIIKAFTLS